jgi:hypothetical protein
MAAADRAGGGQVPVLACTVPQAHVAFSQAEPVLGFSFIHYR